MIVGSGASGCLPALWSSPRSGSARTEPSCRSPCARRRGLGAVLPSTPKRMAAGLRWLSPKREVAMCYSRDWDTTERRKQQEAEAAEAHRKRDGVIKTLLTEAEKAAQARTEKAQERESALTK